MSGINHHRRVDAARIKEEIDKRANLFGKQPILMDRVPALFPGEPGEAIGRRSLFSLAERMASSFCSGVTVDAYPWVEIGDKRVENVKIMTRKSINDPGCPPGILLKASASFWVPLPPRRVFNFVTDLHTRGAWDTLSEIASSLTETSHFSTSQEPGNFLSVIQIEGRESCMVVQETWTGPNGFFVVFAPIDLINMDLLLAGLRDPNNLPILPSGFSILSDGSVGGSLVTATYHTLAHFLPSAEIPSDVMDMACEVVARVVRKLKANLGTQRASL